MRTFNSGGRAQGQHMASCRLVRATVRDMVLKQPSPQSHKKSIAQGNTLLFFPNFYKIHLLSLGGSRDAFFNNGVSSAYHMTSFTKQGAHWCGEYELSPGGRPLGQPVGLTCLFITPTEVGAAARVHYSLFLTADVTQSAAFTFPPWSTESSSCESE